MVHLTQQSLHQLARATCAMGKIIEAHADQEDRVCKVVIELNESMQHFPLREAIVQLWHADRFLVSVSKDGLLMIDGMRDVETTNQWDLLAAVGHQLKEYTKASIRAEACREMSGRDDMAFLSGNPAAISEAHGLPN